MERQELATRIGELMMDAREPGAVEDHVDRVMQLFRATEDNPSGEAFEMVEGVMPDTHAFIYEHPDGASVFISACQLCGVASNGEWGLPSNNSARPIVQKYLRVQVTPAGSFTNRRVPYVVEAEGIRLTREGSSQQCDERLVICPKCVAQIAALWEKAGRPSQDAYEAALAKISDWENVAE